MKSKLHFFRGDAKLFHSLNIQSISFFFFFFIDEIKDVYIGANCPLL